MPKYRSLKPEELKELEKEFIEYLIVNGLTAEDWEGMKKTELEKAGQILELFSDVVLEGVMRKVQYLEHRTPLEIRSFQCAAGKLILVGMKADAGSGADFTQPEYLKEAMQNPPAGLSVYTTEKEYAKDRENEIFDMIEGGCDIADGSVFKALCLTLPA